MLAMYERGNTSVSDADEGFLSHLPPDTPIFHYDSQCHLENILSPISSYDCFIVIKEFPSNLLDDLDEKLAGRLDFSSPLQTLILQMPSEPHEEAAGKFEAMLTSISVQMKVNRRIAYLGATRIDGDDRKKQADRSWMLIRQAGKFPTMALEVGCSQSAAKLEKDITWWLHESQGRMGMGITIDIKRGSGNIEIKSWVPARPFQQHSYVTARQRHVGDKRSNQQPPPQVAQRILIKKGKSGQESTIKGGDLIIPFTALFFSEPGEGEGDFIFTEDMFLHEIADSIWAGIERQEAKLEDKQSKFESHALYCL